MVPRPAVREEEVVRAVEVLEGELDREVDKVIIMNIVTNIKYDQLTLTNVPGGGLQPDPRPCARGWAGQAQCPGVEAGLQAGQGEGQAEGPVRTHHPPAVGRLPALP